MTKIPLAVLALALALPAAAATTVELVHPERYTDVGRDAFRAESDDYLATLGSHLAARADAALPADAHLEVWITDVDMAGEFEPGRPREDVRIVRELYPPAIALRFRLTGADGRVRQEGVRRLTDPAFLRAGRTLPDNDPLRYEKALLDRWLAREFPAKGAVR